MVGAGKRNSRAVHMFQLHFIIKTDLSELTADIWQALWVRVCFRTLYFWNIMCSWNHPVATCIMTTVTFPAKKAKSTEFSGTNNEDFSIIPTFKLSLSRKKYALERLSWVGFFKAFLRIRMLLQGFQSGVFSSLQCLAECGHLGLLIRGPGWKPRSWSC